MSVWQHFWRFLDGNHLAKLAFICSIVGGVVTGIATSGWTVYTYFHPTASQINEKTIKIQLIEGENFLNTGRYTDAKQVFEKILKVSPNDDKALWGLKVAEVKDVKLVSTPAAFKLAIDNLYRLNPKDAHVNLYLGEFYAYTKNTKNDRDKAIAYYQTAISQNPQLAEAYFDIAKVYFEQGQWEATKNESLKAIALSEMPKYQSLLAYVYFKERHYDDAQKVYANISAYPLAALESAKIDWLQGQWAEAIKQQKQAIDWLNDKEVMAQAENQDIWNFEIIPKDLNQKNATFLRTLEEKKAYAIFCLSVSLFLQGEVAEAEKQLKQLKDFNVDLNKDIKDIVRKDSTNLKQAKPEIDQKVTEYEQRYLS